MSSTTAVILVSEFVRALALCWKNLAAYPSGHPVLVKSLDEVNRRLAELRGPAGEVVLGISSDGLLYGESKIDSLGAQKFAQTLYARGVAVLRLSSDTSPADLEQFLRLLAMGAPKDQPRALWEDLTAAGVVSINLQPVNYENVRLTDQLEEKKEHEGSLWDAILKALLQGKQFAAAIGEHPDSVNSAEELTRLLNRYIVAEMRENVPFDPDATFGIRMPVRTGETFLSMITHTVGEFITNAWGMKKQNSIEQAIQLLKTLADPLRGAVMRGVLQALVSDESAGALLRDFASDMPPDEVLEALRYLSSMQKLSTHAVALMESLTRVQAAGRPEAPTAGVIADLVRVFADDDADRFNPADHNALLASAAIRIPRVPPNVLNSLEQLGKSADTVAAAALLRQSSVMVLELLENVEDAPVSAGLFRRLESIFRSHMASGDLDDARDVVEQVRAIGQRTARKGLKEATQQTLEKLADKDTAATLVNLLQGLTAEKAPSAQRLVEMLGAPMRRNLLIALAEEGGLSRRRRIFNFVASLGPQMVPQVIEFLGDSRWYVVRNMIILLRDVHDRSSLPQLRNLARHTDLRVKLEALKSLFALDPGGASVGVLEELVSNSDPKIADTAITLVGSYGIKEGVGPLLRILEGRDVLGSRRTLRMKALKALGELGDPGALDRLEPFFRSSFLPWPSKEERHAAWQSLQKYPADARSPIVERGLHSRDPQVRAICENLVQE